MWSQAIKFSTGRCDEKKATAVALDSDQTKSVFQPIDDFWGTQICSRTYFATNLDDKAACITVNRLGSSQMM